MEKSVGYVRRIFFMKVATVVMPDLNGHLILVNA
jgi:hypothetical protein